MLRMNLAPCSPFTVTNDLMVAAARLARQHAGVRLHTHLAENQEDVDYSLKTYGVRPGEYLKCAAAPSLCPHLAARVFTTCPLAGTLLCCDQRCILASSSFARVDEQLRAQGRGRF